MLSEERDTDHDGFSDVEEINGLIYNQAGQLVQTNYEKLVTNADINDDISIQII